MYMGMKKGDYPLPSVLRASGVNRSRFTAGFARAAACAAMVLSLSGLISIEAFFAPKSDLWPRWAAYDLRSKATIDHGDWDRLLRRYVAKGPDGVNRIAYGKVSPPDRAVLDGYLARMSRISIGRYGRVEQRAYWINIYNALTIRVVLEHYPVRSIRDIDISSRLLSDGPWDKKLFAVEGVALSLNDIEHRILRPIWRDPRIHYAVNCASVGCPDLRRAAYTSANTERLLEEAARDYVNSARGVRLRDGELVVSSIYIWFQEDFGGSDEDVIAHIRHYARPVLIQALDGRTSIDGHAYDWSLNGAVIRP
jgi:hypothetical protein